MSDLKVGFVKNENIVITRDEQFRHIFVYTGSNPAKANVLLLDVMWQQINSNQGILLFQGVSNTLKNNLIEKVKASHRVNDLVILTDLCDYTDPKKLKELVLGIITESKIAYVNFDGIDKQLYTRLFMQAISDAMDTLRTTTGPKHKQCNFIATNIEQIHSKKWMKIHIFARLNNISVITSTTTYTEVLNLKSNLAPMYAVIEELFAASQTKILFNQGNREQNAELCRITGIQGFTLQKGEIFKASFLSKSRDAILNKINDRQYIMLYEDSITPVSF